jgi:hypothetical protein
VVGRFTVRASTSPAQAAALASGARPATARAWLDWNAKKAAKRVAPSAYRRVREVVLGRRARP